MIDAPVTETWLKTAETPEEILQVVNGWIARMRKNNQTLQGISIWGDEHACYARITFTVS